MEKKNVFFWQFIWTTYILNLYGKLATACFFCLYCQVIWSLYNSVMSVRPIFGVYLGGGEREDLKANEFSQSKAQTTENKKYRPIYWTDSLPFSLLENIILLWYAKSDSFRVLRRIRLPKKSEMTCTAGPSQFPWKRISVLSFDWWSCERTFQEMTVEEPVLTGLQLCLLSPPLKCTQSKCIFRLIAWSSLCFAPESGFYSTVIDVGLMQLGHWNVGWMQRLEFFFFFWARNKIFWIE